MTVLHLERLPDWEARLSDYLAGAAPRPFAWGQHDCLLHCAAAIEAQTGVDLGEPHRGRYSSGRGATRHLKLIGYRTVRRCLDALLPAQPLGQARRGDIVLAGRMAGVSLGLTAVFVGRDGEQVGLVHVPRADWTASWRVG